LARQQVFDRGALTLIHRYSGGIPRIVNLICEHCLVNAFVEGQKVVKAEMVEAISSDLDLCQGRPDSSALEAEPQSVPAGKFDLIEAIKMLAERLRHAEGIAHERKA